VTVQEAINEILSGAAGRSPSAPALVDDAGYVVTYGELPGEIHRRAAAFEAAGLDRYARVLLAARGDIEGALTLLSLMSICCVCPSDPAGTRDEYQHLIQAFAPNALVATADNPGLAEVADRGNAPLLRVGPGHGAVHGRVGAGACKVQMPDSGAQRTPLVLQTSGTASSFKLVPLTGDIILAGATATCRAYGLEPRDRRLNVMPLFHIQGIVGSLLAALVSGSSVVLVPGFDPLQTIHLLADERVTWFSGTPPMLRLLAAAGIEQNVDLSHLRFIRAGSSALPQAVRDTVLAAFAVPVVESFGMSEAHQVASTTMSRSSGERTLRPTGSEVAVLTDDGTVSRAAGTAGELLVRGANVIDRYLFPPDADEDAFHEGWLRTGDVARLCKGGFEIVGRRKEIINRGGLKVSPREVEDALLTHPAVAEAVVFGMSDPQHDEEIVAALTLERAVDDLSELRRHVGSQLATWKAPTRIVVRDALPRTPSGKLVRRSLTERLGIHGNEGSLLTRSVDNSPNGDLERKLCVLWAAALNRGSVPVEEDFFGLGGDSLIGLSLLASVRAALGITLSPQELFDSASSVAKMALVLRQRTADGEEEVRIA
jgi:acyl-CoA synthetase (AMP-forming)/AMP-acid ligase II